MTKTSTPGAPTPALLHDPALVGTTFVVLDFEGTTPRGYSPEPVEVAAIALRRDGDGGTDGQWRQVWSFDALMKPPAHAAITDFDTSQHGITAAMVADRPGSATVLGQFDAQVGDGPHLLVAHNTTMEGGIIYRYRDACPALAATHLLDTVKLARALLPDAPGYGLDALIDHLRLPRPATRHRAMPDVEVTVALFEHLLEVAATRGLRDLADVVRVCGSTAKATLPIQDSIF
ncbi:3'-5' exonuclease [Catenulispora sp. NF23]|uniref:3'-5' exonuclease n=1 Tax=Catenulispora pinistramenti TaxID=2705254 RepID=A0ABS5L796_9ACTN|nr:3'-5' exonuclease [Catenulispora pinistramenti]MBS2531810.1 3'-5' exonuclease [Catenulispora pinistramenti]MBS2554196.1 3'-5' exonuclease [Catenulispora pinistramenti]